MENLNYNIIPRNTLAPRDKYLANLSFLFITKFSPIINNPFLLLSYYFTSKYDHYDGFITSRKLSLCKIIDVFG